MVHGHDAMVSSFAVARWILGVLSLFCAYFLGRCVARWFVFQDHRAPLTRWGFRTAIAAVALVWAGGVDLSSVLALAGTLLSGVMGFLRERRPKPPEENLSKVIFPKE